MTHVPSLRFSGAITFGVLVSARAVSWLDNSNRKLKSLATCGLFLDHMNVLSYKYS